jgi:hypothetical protein
MEEKVSIVDEYLSKELKVVWFLFMNLLVLRHYTPLRRYPLKKKKLQNVAKINAKC